MTQQIIDGVVAPAGGFQQGGWYQGRQFWNGTLSPPGVINSQSNQQGAGQAVSAEVVAASNIDQGLAPGTNEAFLAQQQQIINPSGIPNAAGAVGAISDSQKAYDELNSSMNNKRAEADKRRSEVNENPFLAEASRVGRIAKIDSLLNDSLATDQIQLTNLEKKVTAEAEATKPDLMITTETDNAGNVSILTIDKKTGKLVSVANGGQVGKADKPTTPTDSKTLKLQFLDDVASIQGQSIGDTWVGLFPQLVIKYAPYMTLEEIYTNYKLSPSGKQYGNPTEDPKDIKNAYDRAKGTVVF